jgi:hypothetical protein
VFAVIRLAPKDCWSEFEYTPHARVLAAAARGEFLRSLVVPLVVPLVGSAPLPDGPRPQMFVMTHACESGAPAGLVGSGEKGFAELLDDHYLVGVSFFANAASPGSGGGAALDPLPAVHALMRPDALVGFLCSRAPSL